jgi:hypothetical protein
VLGPELLEDRDSWYKLTGIQSKERGKKGIWNEKGNK